MANQLTEQKYICQDNQRNEIHKALIKEYEALSKRASEQKIKLHNGILQQIFADKFIYKFPLPKEPERPLEPDKPYILSIDGNIVKGSISAIPQDKSEVEIELYENNGRIIPAIDIIIDLKVLIDLIDRRIVAIDKEPTKFKTETAIFLFNPNSSIQVSKLNRQLIHSPRNDDISLTEQQISAIDATLKQKLTIIWGPPGTGKTITLQGVIAELLENGRKILFVSNTNNAIDGLLKGLIKKSPYKTFEDLKNDGKIIRIGSQTDKEVKEHFGSIEVSQYKSQEIQNEINTLQEKIEIEQKELKQIEEELKQFEYGKYLREEINKLSEKANTFPSTEKIKEQIIYVNQCKEKLFTSIKESESIKDITLKAESVAEKLQNQIKKVAGINANVHRISTEIETKENEIKNIQTKSDNLENAFLSFLRHKNEIKNLKEKSEKIATQITEQNSALETYKKQQAFEISIESELTGEFVNTVKSIVSTVLHKDFDFITIQKYFGALNLSLKPEEKKPHWILLSEEYKLVNSENASQVNEFVSLRLVSKENIAKKYEQIISEFKKQIENNDHLRNLCETKLNKLQKQFPEYKSVLEKPEYYWNERNEKINHIKKLIEPIQVQLNLLNEKLRNIEKYLIKEAKFICCTLVKSSYDETLSECEFDSLIVDEASMALLPQLYCTAALIKERIILCGDHLQLQPISTSRSKVALKWLASSYYDFIELNGEITTEKDEDTSETGKEVKRVVELKKLNEYQKILSSQHRMPPSISSLVKPWYKKAGNVLIDSYEIPDDFKEFHLNGHFLSDNSSIFFVDTSSIRTYHSRTSDKSPYNLINAAIVAEITRELVEKYKIEIKNIRCISPYRAQYQLTSALLFKFFPTEFKDKLSGIASSVHKMQGGEAPIIFYDLTDGNQGGFTFFLKTDDLHIHNVAITRSKFKLIFVGDLKKVERLREANPKSSFNDVLKQLLTVAKIIDAKPIKEKIFKQFSEKDLMNENTLNFTEEQRNNIVILPSNLYYKFLEIDIEHANHSILFVSPFVTKPRWKKLKNALLDFKRRTDGTMTIITRPPDKMFGGDKINMAAVDVLNEFLKHGFNVKVSPKIHSKLVVIDGGTSNAISYWGSLNPLSFNDTDEINTRLADKEIAEQLINMSLIGNIYPYKKTTFNKKSLADDTKEAVRNQLSDFRWTLAGFYGRPIFAIYSNETINKIIEYLPSNRNEYMMIPQFNRKNFVLWNHIDEIEEIILPLREFNEEKKTNSQVNLFDFN